MIIVRLERVEVDLADQVSARRACVCTSCWLRRGVYRVLECGVSYRAQFGGSAGRSRA
jgi:hypothetical protein